MPRLPAGLWIAGAGVALLLVGLCVATVRAVLRPAVRARVARWPAAGVLGLLALAAVPWLVATLAPLTVKASIHGVWQLLGWTAIALLVFALLVLLPLAALLAAASWTVARRRDR